MLGVVLAVGRASAEPSPAPAAAAQLELVTGDQFQGIILPVGKWTPSRADVLAAETKLPSLLAHGVQVDGHLIPISPERLSRYKRQYVGEGRPSKRRLAVYLNCRLEGWPRRITWARGGGACFIRATWDPAREEFVEIVANSAR